MRYFFVLMLVFCAFATCNKPHRSESDVAFTASFRLLNDLITKKSEDTIALISALQTAYSMAETHSDRQYDSLIAVNTRSLGNVFWEIDKIEEARFHYQKGLQFGSRHLDINEDIMTRLYRNIANTFYYQQDYKTALIYYDSSKITRQDSASQILKIDNLLRIAECYQFINDFKSATFFFKEAELAVKKWQNPLECANFYNRYSSSLRQIRKYEEAFEKSQIALKIMKKIKDERFLTQSDSNILANTNYIIAYTLSDSGVYSASEPFYLQAISIYEKQKNWESYKRGLSNIAIMYRLNKQFEKAEKTLTEGIALFKGDLNDNDIRLKASFYVNRSEVYLETKQYKKAMADHDSAIYFFTLYEKKPSLTAIMMQARPVLLSVLADKAKASIELNENGANTEGSLKALKLTQEIIKIADDIRADYFSDEAKLTLANDIKPALEKAISVCQKLYQKTKDKQYLEQAFGFVEYSRSMVLYENARLDNKLPPDLKAENEELKKREAALIAKNNVEDLQNYLRLKRQFREKIKALNRNQLATVSELKTALIKDNKTALIEFFVGDSAIFVFTLIQNDLTLIELKKQKDFDKQIESLRQEITKANPVRDAGVFENQAKSIYNALLTNTIAQLPTTINQLIMAPDGVLNYLPFEILIKGDPSVYLKNFKDSKDSKGGKPSKDSSFITHHSSFQKIDFLIKNYQISYAYSANLLLEQKRIKKESAPKLFAGFAAKYDNKDTSFAIADVSRAVLTRDGAYELKGANEEVKSISDLVGGKAYLNEFATEGSFKKEANQYKILHFAMHSLTDDKDPSLSKLLFTLTPKDTTNDNDLTAAELYATSLNADLAVLSACNTGFGTLNKGEGVMSLARAFTYAGVPSTVTSLWKVPDLTTREIMVEFYKNLKSGMTKDAALRQAKLTYLENAPESIAANPYFWAGFVPMGNMEAMDFSERGPLSIKGILAAFLGILGVLGIGFWFWNGKKESLN
jgi:CHAT domain-containing protein/tetratricopeptide (TPR) repeat protein